MAPLNIYSIHVAHFALKSFSPELFGFPLFLQIVFFCIWILNFISIWIWCSIVDYDKEHISLGHIHQREFLQLFEQQKLNLHQASKLFYLDLHIDIFPHFVATIGNLLEPLLWGKSKLLINLKIGKGLKICLTGHIIHYEGVNNVLEAWQVWNCEKLDVMKFHESHGLTLVKLR